MEEKNPNDLDPMATELTSNVAVDIILSLITCGLFNLYIQHRQIKATNYILRESRYGFWKWLLLSLITCGIYHIYFEYVMSRDLVRATGEPESNEPVICLVVSLFAMTIIADAIIQSRINRYFGNVRP